MKKNLFIGSLLLKYPYFPSPLAGLTDLPFRKLLADIGYCGALFTEMISVEGLIRKNPQTLKMLEILKGDIPNFVQLFGNESSKFREAIKIIEDKFEYDGIDLNAGCPVKKVVKKGAGAYLLKDTKNLREIVRAIREETKKPFTVKIRLGFDKINVFEVVKIIEGEGADAITVHFRTKKDGYSSPARWEFAQKLRELVKIPVIGNGDILKAQDAKEKLRYADAIMVGRGIVINPDLFKEIVTGKKESALKILNRFIFYMEEFYPSVKYLPRLKAFLRYCTKGKGISKIKKKEIFLSKDYDFVKEETLKIFSEL